MAVPKRKHSKARTRSRKANWRRIAAPNANTCPSCGEPKLPHRACLSCGSYKGRQVMKVKKAE
ncbi:MAG TPA: 50S ribosomal protein L32 [Firmicutes bacterium]|nr:50S ribosomal protein L32 [Bacillota bacterium]